ncbi:hypothetical protein [Streptomyces sp. NPDC051677]|uniref:hypothetical protein n=1 Tax=Streptomyces sp. NPDC051677 TaxID=3365669 RepID=UPI0037D96FBA
MACFTHLTAPERVACEQARKRYNRLAAERRRQEEATRQASLGEQTLTVDRPDLSPSPPQSPCVGKCISQEKALGYDNDGAMTQCAHCDGFVCLHCGVQPVHDMLVMCDACDRPQPDDPGYEPVTPLGDETYEGPLPQQRLTSAVARIVAHTGRSYATVNWVINRQSGVRSRSGATEHVIRRAAWVAGYWLRELGEAPLGNQQAGPGIGTPR